jgi:hypothetical protein
METMRRLCRVLGFLLVLGGLALLGHEIAAWIGSGPYRLIPAGELWASLDANSLVGFQGVIERASPWLWATIVLPILTAPAWVIPLALGLLGLLVCRRRRRRSSSIA